MSKFSAINPEPKYYDIEDYYDKLNFEKIPNVTTEFGIPVRKVIPSEGEIRLLGNRHFDCSYFSMGLDVCRSKVINDNRKSFLGCKETLDAMFRCYTNDADVTEYHKVREVAKPYMNKFMNCLFTKESLFDSCMVHFEDSIRAIYRDKEHGLIDYY